jgi:hypothetical protein
MYGRIAKNMEHHQGGIRFTEGKEKSTGNVHF